VRTLHDLHLPAGSAAEGADPLVLTPERCGWRFCGLRVVRLAAGERRAFASGGDELAVVPLAGGCVVECDGERFELDGRESVFARVTDWAYVPRDADVVLTSAGGCELALPSAPARRRLAAAYGAAEAVPVELRGAGQATRQIANFMAPGQGPSDRLTCVEVLTPAGNTSSHPPHKHDVAGPGEAELEEIYYFRVGGHAGFGFHRTYDLVEGWDVTATIRDGDVFLVPRGYHGPCAAPPGYAMWYLNVLAGPGEERSLAFSDDPAHHWLRATFEHEPLDPRLPMTGPRGVIGR
jgi:5-deoxy-glucuronate isomerase